MGSWNEVDVTKVWMEGKNPSSCVSHKRPTGGWLRALRLMDLRLHCSLSSDGHSSLNWGSSPIIMGFHNRGWIGHFSESTHDTPSIYWPRNHLLSSPNIRVVQAAVTAYHITSYCVSCKQMHLLAGVPAQRKIYRERIKEAKAFHDFNSF